MMILLKMLLVNMGCQTRGCLSTHSVCALDLFGEFEGRFGKTKQDHDSMLVADSTLDLGFLSNDQSMVCE